jgi:hypothetical protein
MTLADANSNQAPDENLATNAPRQSPIRAIRAHCRDCAGGSPKEVRYCTCTECSLWPYRFGRRPSTVIQAEGQKSAQFFDKRNFEEGGCFDPDKGVSELE